MPILKLDRSGNVVESDARLNGVQGIGRLPDMVDDDDVTSLSLIENNKTLKDRAGLRRLEAMTKMNKIKKYSQDQALQKKLQEKKAQVLEKMYVEKKKQQYKNNLYKDMSYLKARQDGGKTSVMSGVAGFGFSADGRQAVLSQASVDWQPIQQANSAFGGDAENWGNDTAFGIHSNDSVNKMNLSGFGANEGSPEPKEMQTLRDDPAQATIGSSSPVSTFTEKDKFILEAWNNGTYVSPIWYNYANTPPTVWKNILWTDILKSELADNNTEINHSSLMTAFARQGWGYSMFKDTAGKINVVRVAFHWGLPMINIERPYNPLFTPDYIFEQRHYSRDHIFEAGTGYGINSAHKIQGANAKLNIWNVLSPVIMAAAREYNYKFGKPVSSGIPVHSTSQKAMTNSSGLSFTQRLKLLFGNKGDYNHPLIKQGLIK